VDQAVLTNLDAYGLACHPPLASACHQAGLPLWEPERLRNFCDPLLPSALRTADKLVVVADGTVQPRERLGRTVTARATCRVSAGGLVARADAHANTKPETQHSFRPVESDIPRHERQKKRPRPLA
jgi:hypothetical protein